MFWVIIIAMGLCGGTMVYFSWKRVRLDNHPYCAACGFDLFGLPEDSNRCSECGAKLNSKRSVRQGRFRHRRRRLAMGLTVVALAAGLAPLRDFTDPTRIDPQYKPTWLLLWQGDSQAYYELLERELAGSLTPSQRLGLARLILAMHGQGARWGEPSWIELMSDMYTSGRLSETEWKAYWDKASPIELCAIRPRVRRGEPVPVELKSSGRLRAPSRTVTWTVESARIDSKPCPTPRNRGVMWTVNWACQTGTDSEDPLVIPPHVLNQLADGPHRVDLVYRITVYDGVAPALSYIACKDFAVSETVTILPATEHSVVQVMRPELEKAMKDGIGLVPVIEIVPGYSVDETVPAVTATMYIDEVSTPVRGVFSIVIRSRGQEWNVALLDTRPPHNAATCLPRLMGPSDLVNFPADLSVADVVLRPSPKAAAETADALEIWGQEIVFKDVRVECKAPR